SVTAELATEQKRDVTMIAEQDIGLPRELGQHFAWIAVALVPQLRAVIAVERHAHPFRPRGFGRCNRRRHSLRAQCGGHSGKMEQVSASEQPVPLIGRLASKREATMLAIVRNRCWPHA